MDIRKVKKLIELLEESGIDELEIHEGEESVRISRHSKQVAMQQPYYAQAPMPTPAAAPAAAAPAADTAPAQPKLNGTVVRSPMVGTFYRASSRKRQASSKSVRALRRATSFASSRR